MPVLSGGGQYTGKHETLASGDAWVGASGADGAGGVAVSAAGIGSQIVISSVCGMQERGDCSAAVRLMTNGWRDLGRLKAGVGRVVFLGAWGKLGLALSRCAIGIVHCSKVDSPRLQRKEVQSTE
jgi:hypothetical protein